MDSHAADGIKAMVAVISTGSRLFGFACCAWALSACGFSTLEGLSDGFGDASDNGTGGAHVDASPDSFSSGRGGGGRGGAAGTGVADASPDLWRTPVDVNVPSDVAADVVS